MPTDANFEMLKPPAGLKATEGPAVKVSPVEDAPGQETHVDEIEGVVGPGPVLVSILYFEADIRRRSRGLDGCDVCANYISGGVLVSKVT